MEGRILDVGCGKQCLPGAIGIDRIKNFDGQIVHDLNQDPWPLPNDQFERIRCLNVIEHLREVHTVAREMYRVSKNGGQIDFVTPHFSSYASWGDPTHIHHYALVSIPMLFEQAIGVGKFRVVDNKLRFSGAILDFFGWLAYKISPKRYEKHLAWIFPANEVHTVVEVIKPPNLN